MKRRDFITKLGGGVLGAASPSFFISQAQATTNKTLVVLFQRGGNDGLNTVVPYGDDDYYRLRPRIAISRPGSGAGTALDLDGFYGLHPAMREIATLYREGRVAVFPAVQHPRSSRSHFHGQVTIETGSPTPMSNGWLGRHLKSTPSSGPLRAVSFGHSLSKSLGGAGSVPVFSSLDQLKLSHDPAEEKMMLARLKAVYRYDKHDRRRYRGLMAGTARSLWRNYAALSSLEDDVHSGANGVEYPDNSLGVSLRDIARMIKSGIPLEVAALAYGDWDTHIEQGGAQGRQAESLAGLSKSISSFFADLGSKTNDVMVLVMTEFGRTAAENASGGTDHGHASAWFALGGAVKGGIYDGEAGWPGLAPDKLYLERYLAHTVDYRNVMAEVLRGHLGNPKAFGLFPSFAANPMGFI